MLHRKSVSFNENSKLIPVNASPEVDGEKRKLEAFVHSLSGKYSCSILEDSPGRYKTTWSLPSASKPIPSPVVNVYVNVAEDGQLDFQIENQKFKYRSGNELKFDRVLDFVMESKLAARRAGIDLSYTNIGNH
jgi:hypothetical protein